MVEPNILRILMVDDDPADVRITREALKDSKFVNQVDVCHDGLHAMNFLKRRTPHESAARPDLILLDINMPKMNGHETLKAIRADPELTHIPVVMLTTSDAEKDIMEAYREHVSAYVTKPVDLDAFLHIIQQIEGFWVGLVRLPPQV